MTEMDSGRLARLLILAGLLLLVLAAVVGRRPAPVSAPKEFQLAPGESLRFSVDTGSGPTEEAPEIRLHLVITDKATGKSVPATVSLNGQVVARHVAVAEARLPGRLTDEPVTIRVDAAGYKVWEVEARWNFKRSRQYRVPVKLQKLDSQT